MRNSDFKKLLPAVNLIVIFYYVLEILIPWLIGDLNRSFWRIVLWTSSYLFIYLCNYFFITPYVFRNGFNIKKFLITYTTFILAYMVLCFLMGSWMNTWGKENPDDFRFEFNYNYHVVIFLVSSFYFLYSMGMRVIQMHLENQLQIEDLESEQKKITLQNLQTTIESDLISKYIYYLQEKNELSDVSTEIVELSNFLRYSTYRIDDENVPFQLELQELKRFKEILFKSKGPKITIKSRVEVNPLIPAFGLLTPIKEVLIQVPGLEEVNLLITGSQKKIKMMIESKDLSFDGLNLELSNLNRDKNQLEVDIL